MQKKYGFAPSGGADSAVKQMIFGTNAARLYRLKLRAAENAPMPAYSADRLAHLRSEYELGRGNPPTCATVTSAPAERDAGPGFVSLHPQSRPAADAAVAGTDGFTPWINR